jgi:hypothetical protein
MLGNDIFSDFSINQANRRSNEWQQYAANLEVTAQTQANLAEEYILACASNLGARSALAAQLKVADPENPLLKDASILEKLMDAAVAAFELADRDFDAARKAGREFKIPGREPAAPQRSTLLKQDPEQIKVAYAGVIALRNALSEQLKRFDPENPLLKDIYLQERIRTKAITAYKTSGNFDAAREVGRTFVVPNHD